MSGRHTWTVGVAGAPHLYVPAGGVLYLPPGAHEFASVRIDGEVRFGKPPERDAKTLDGFMVGPIESFTRMGINGEAR